MSISQNIKIRNALKYHFKSYTKAYPQLSELLDVLIEDKLTTYVPDEHDDTFLLNCQNTLREEFDLYIETIEKNKKKLEKQQKKEKIKKLHDKLIGIGYDSTLLLSKDI